MGRAVLLCAALIACGSERPPSETSSELGVLVFDGAMLAPEGTGDDPDLGVSLGEEGAPCASAADCRVGLMCRSGACGAPNEAGEPCASDSACADGLECHSAVCTRVGAVGEPCTRAGACQSGLACAGGQCRETARLRLCHCIFESSTLTPARLDLEVEGTRVATTPADLCSDCAIVPLGEIRYAIRRSDSGALLSEGTLDIPAGNPEVALVFSHDTLELLGSDCDARVSGFCRL